MVLFSVLLLMFQFKLISPEWIFAGVLITFLFFYGIYHLQGKFTSVSAKSFETRLFWNSLFIRILSITILMFIAEITWERPFYVGAVDSTRYYRVATEVASLFWEQGFGHLYQHLINEYRYADNIGVPFFLGLLFAITGNSVIIANLIIALLGSFSVVLIYRTASYLVEQSEARLAGWMAAFMPLSLFYDTVILKESFVVFLTSTTAYLATRMIITGGVTNKRIILLVLSTVSIFYFRTAAGAIISLCIPLFFLFNTIKKNPFYSWGAGIAIVALFVLIINLTGETEFFMERIEGGTEHGDARLASVEQRTTWQSLSAGPIFIILAHFAPFPSMMELNPYYGHDATYYWIGGLVVWNILAYYALLGLWVLIKTQPQQSLMVWGWAAGYTLVLGLTAMFTQVRLGWNVMPMMMIPAAIGLKNYRSINTFYIALAIAGVLIIAWNLFRGVGRGVM